MTPFRRDLLSGLILTVYLISTWIVGFDSREIRPSDHGFSNQTPPVAESPQMTLFFNTTPPSPSNVARNSSDPNDETGVGWFVHVRSKRGSHVREVALLAGSLACGVVGMAFLVGAAFVYLFHHWKERKC